MSRPPSPSPLSLDEKAERLVDELRKLESALVCYSGGTDSALVLAVAHAELGERALGLTAVSPSLPKSELAAAEELARRIGARHLVVATSELERPGYRENGADRCFHCKSELYEVAERTRLELGFAHVVNGTNVDDLGDYRPGLEAARNARVSSPLVAAGFGKDDVRALARKLDLPIWDKPAAACLSSRLPYGVEVTRERLLQVEGFEEDLKALGFRAVRVRWHDTIARIEVPTSELARLTTPELHERVVAAGRRHGFRYVTLDLAGYRVGSHNEVLDGRKLRVV